MKGEAGKAVRAPGRPPGAPNKRTLAAREKAAEILATPEYRESLVRRIQQDTLAPLMERTLWEYAYGVPKQKVEVNVNRPDYSELSNEELAARAEELRQQLLEDAREEERIAEETAKQQAVDALFAKTPNAHNTVQ